MTHRAIRFMPARGLLAAVLTAAAPSLASAAVRHCAPRIEVAADDPAELAARQKALQQWVAEARRIGDGFTRWQLSAGRAIQCARVPAGFLCRASGAPCTISHSPGRVPRELQPPVSPQPPARKKGIDA